jgi:hypothetical protein
MTWHPQARSHRRNGRRIAAGAGALVIAMLPAACGSGTSPTTSGTTTPATGSTTSPPVSKTLGPGVTATTIKLGVALVDFKCIAQFTDLLRTKPEQLEIYGAYIKNINANGGIAGRKIVPDYKFYCPLTNTAILTDCTSFAQDDNVFAVVGTFVDFSGDAQTCIAKQQHRVLMTFNLTQAIIDKSPPGLVLTAGDIPERSATILVSLLKARHTLAGKTVAVLGDSSESSVVNGTVVPGLKQSGAKMGSTAILNVGTTGDTTAAQTQLDSFIEKWKSEHVNAVFLSGDLASTKQFVVKLTSRIPGLLLMADNTDVLNQAQQLQKSGPKPNPYEGVLTAGGLTPKEYDNSANWKYCSDIYQAETGKVAENAEQIKKTKDGKIDDTYGTINDACQTLTMLDDIGERVGKYLNNANWVNTVDNFGHIENRGSGPYSSLHTGKYAADDNWRLQAYDSTIPPEGNWKAVTPLQNISS